MMILWKISTGAWDASSQKLCSQNSSLLVLRCSERNILETLSELNMDIQNYIN